MGTYLRELRESYPINTNVTGFKRFSIKLCDPCALDKSSHSLGRVSILITYNKWFPGHCGRGECREGVVYRHEPGIYRRCHRLAATLAPHEHLSGLRHARRNVTIMVCSNFYKPENTIIGHDLHCIRPLSHGGSPL